MKTYWCLDVSGSVDDQSIQWARMWILDHWKDGDRCVVFDVSAMMLSDRASLVHALDNDIHDRIFGGGGSDATECLQLVEVDCEESRLRNNERQTVLLSDGCLAGVSKFDQFIDIYNIPKGKCSCGKPLNFGADVPRCDVCALARLY